MIQKIFITFSNSFQMNQQNFIKPLDDHAQIKVVTNSKQKHFVHKVVTNIKKCEFLGYSSLVNSTWYKVLCTLNEVKIMQKSMKLFQFFKGSY
jgi:Icc-related predicted phosphoesterase